MKLADHPPGFPDYSLDELVPSASWMLTERATPCRNEAQQTFRDYLARRMTQPAGSPRTAASATPWSAPACATRTAAGRRRFHASSKDDLMRLEPADFLASRVFTS